MKRSESVKALATALAKAQLEMPSALKASKNPHFNSTFAGLPEVAEVAKVLNKHGLAYVQPTSNTADSVTIETVLIHGESGEWVAGELTLRPMKADPQGFGSAITYGRRYGLCALVGIVADEDDDGNEATRPTYNAGGNGNGNGHSRPAAPPPQRAAPQVDPASSALADEFTQGIAQAKDDSTIKHIIASVAVDHKAHKLNDLQAKALKEAIVARRQELGIGPQAAAS